MLFSSHLPLPVLIELCRVLRHNLSAGLTIRDVFRQQAERGPMALRPVADRIHGAIEKGEQLQAALDQERDHFPPLFLSLAVVGEETGHLPEIFGELEKYFTLQLRLKRQFRSQAMMPVIQLGLAFLVIALLIFILGWIAQVNRSQAPGILGQTGGSGAVLFLILSFGSILSLWLGYQIATRVFQQKPVFDRLILRVPGLGPVLEALVLGRFAMALQLTLEAGLPIARALRLSLQATGNTFFTSRMNIVTDAVKAGARLTTALTRSGLFREEFINMVAIAEEGGRVTEMMSHQAAYYFEEVSRRLPVLVRLASFSVWCAYAIFMIVAIFRIASMYLNALGGGR
jgi:type II secretory pathway component PulF